MDDWLEGAWFDNCGEQYWGSDDKVVAEIRDRERERMLCCLYLQGWRMNDLMRRRPKNGAHFAYCPTTVQEHMLRIIRSSSGLLPRDDDADRDLAFLWRIRHSIAELGENK